ncbi:hypothetical protein GCM10022419_121740 [Nonomuraea rosea]|uniref:Secreted protein n=1 Tax=Nonomuraea rosea TaxID=638574 RepID=A0ABP6ZPY5_9ACTN
MCAKTLLLAGGAAAVIVTVVALNGAGSNKPGNQQGSSPQTMDTSRDVSSHHVATSSLPRHKSSVPSPAPASLALPHSKTEGGEGRNSAKQMTAARNRAPINEPHGRHELARPQPLTGPAADRHPPRPSPKAKRAPRDLRPSSPGTSRSDGSPSLFTMKCDELFPPNKRESRLRNIACHRLFN